MKIGLCGNFNLDPLADQLDKVMPLHEIIVGGTNAYMTELGSPFGEFSSLDICIIALDWRKSVPLIYEYAYGDDAEKPASGFRKECETLSLLIKKFRETCNARIFIFSPVSEYGCPAGFLDRLLPDSRFELHAMCQKIYNEFCRSVTEVYPVDTEETACRIGKDHIYDAGRNSSEKYPFTSEMTAAVVGKIAAMCTQFEKYPLKCLVLDLDDTLWGGTVGEDGFDNILMGELGPGRAYRNFQSEIVKLYKQGVLLAICSKNNTCDALDVMERHPDMLIRPSMISCFRINWDDKPKNMLEISAELNIGLESIMFVDNNPSERRMMSQALPQVEILELPDNPFLYAEKLNKCSRFWPVQLTRDDSGKNVFFSKEQIRKAAAAKAANIEKFLIDSRIRVKISKATQESLPRITQLFNKTNQFNLTTRRFTQIELENIIKDTGNCLFCMEMSDIYGDYGMIACTLVKNDVIDSFVLSCRAFGKRAEIAFLNYILDNYKRNSFQKIHAFYIPSLKNSVVKDFYKDAGFILQKEDANVYEWVYDLTGEIKSYVPWITVEVF